MREPKVLTARLWHTKADKGQKESPQGTFLLPPPSGLPPERPLALPLCQLPFGRFRLLSPLGATLILSQNRVTCQEGGQHLRGAEAKFFGPSLLSSSVIKPKVEIPPH
jgi:hypothetical protein